MVEKTSSEDKKIAPLSGIKVIDFSRFLPGPYSTWLMSDLGAEVIRIEHAREVEKLAGMFGINKLSEADQAQIHASNVFLRGKKNVTLDLGNPEHREAAYKLIDNADVLVEDFRPGVMDSMEFGAEAMMARNPRLIYSSVSACGQTGPYAKRPGHEPIALAIAGVLSRLGPAERPELAGVPFADLLTGTNAALAVLAALIARGTTGRGQRIDTAMSDSAMPLIGMLMWRSGGVLPIPPRGQKHMYGGIWRTRDGRFIATSDMEPRYWKAFCEALDRPEYVAKMGDKSSWPAMQRDFADIIESQDAAHWLDILGEAGTQHALVYDLDEAMEDPHNLERGMAVEMEGPNGATIRHVGSPLHLSDTPVVEPTVAHPPGSDTREVLASIGMEHLLAAS